MSRSRARLCSFILVTLAGCGATAKETAATSDSEPAGVCVPGGTPKSMPATAREYVEMCEPELGVPPEMNCSDGVTVPITVDGVESTELLPEFSCDAPSLQNGDCVPGSTINRVIGRTRDGVERPEVVWVQFCRSEPGWGDSSNWDNIFTGAQMIGYNADTGATCYFELNVGSQGEWVGRDENNRASGLLPSFDDPDFDEAFLAAPTQCVQCHQNDPFVHHPWIDGARLPSNPAEAVLPALAADAPYYVVGGSDWDMRTIHIEGNACLDCHRIGMETDMLYRYNGFDANEWMPSHDPGSLAADYAELLECWENGPENTPGCVWWYPPGGGCEGREAGADFPFAADHFNMPRDSFYGF